MFNTRSDGGEPPRRGRTAGTLIRLPGTASPMVNTTAFDSPRSSATVPTLDAFRSQLSHETDPQSDFPGGRPRHPVPPGHQGDAQGDAAGGRPAADPARGRRGARGRHRAL